MIGIFLFHFSPVFSTDSVSLNPMIDFFTCKIDSHADFLLILEF